MNNKIYDVLKELQIDAYVGYDFRGSNYTLRNILGFTTPTTRRFVAVFSRQGTLNLLIPKLEVSLFENVAAEKHVYATYQQFQAILQKLIGEYSVIASDFSKNNDIPV